MKQKEEVGLVGLMCPWRGCCPGSCLWEFGRVTACDMGSQPPVPSLGWVGTDDF